jgi:2-polyprenyl-3-methyl-5-hydroxy-6-metoxy-1,4-benzoquinol methylase
VVEQGRYDFERLDMVGYVPPESTRVLEVGCATGRFGRQLRTRSPGMKIVGIDPTPPDQPHAYDERLVGSFPDTRPVDTFDCVVFNDVLEHMVDPWAALATTATELLDPGGLVVASIPNVRSIKVLKPLLVSGRWNYTDFGLLDRTHLRFFTRATIVEMFEGAGLTIERLDAINTLPFGRVAALNRRLRGVLTDFLADQFAVVASG